MAKKKLANSESVELTPFEDREVLLTSVAIYRAGDGLSKALEVEPREMRVGDRGVIAIEYEVGKVRFDPIGDTQALERVHMLYAEGAAFIDNDIVRDALEAQRRKIDAAAGVFHLPFGDGEKPEGMSDEEWEASVHTAEANEG